MGFGLRQERDRCCACRALRIDFAKQEYHAAENGKRMTPEASDENRAQWLPLSAEDCGAKRTVAGCNYCSALKRAFATCSAAARRFICFLSGSEGAAERIAGRRGHFSPRPSG